MITKETLLTDIEIHGVCTCTLTDGTTFHIGDADFWISSEEGGYMCDLLGNVTYSSKESCVNALFEYMDGRGFRIESVE
jgi:hypothetical protein